VPLAHDPDSRRRPPAVTLVAALYVIQGGLVLTLLVAALATVLVTEDAGAVLSLQRDEVFALAGSGVACVCLLVAAFGLVMLRRWGWIVAMTTECFVLTFDLASYLAGQPYYVGMVIGALTVLLLNQRDVRLLFEAEGRGGA
jgi:hypothetical protein